MSLFTVFINLSSLLIFYLIYINKNFFIKKLNLIDTPNSKKIHKLKTPLVGGILIFLSLIYLIFINLLLDDKSFPINLIYILFPIFIIGILDDILNLSPTKKLLILSVIIILFLYFNDFYLLKELYFDDFKKIYLLNTFFSFFITTLCLLLLINAFNMSDGINGLAHSISILWLIILTILFDLSIIYYFIILIIFVSFILNYKGKYFLGNSGSLSLSLFIGLVAIYSYNTNHIYKNFVSVEKIILIFLIPGLDMLRLFILRIASKKSPFVGDLGHFHHFLISNLPLRYAIFYYLLIILWPFIFLEFYKIKYSFIFAIQAILFFFLVSYFKSKKNIK